MQYFTYHQEDRKKVTKYDRRHECDAFDTVADPGVNWTQSVINNCQEGDLGEEQTVDSGENSSRYSFSDPPFFTPISRIRTGGWTWFTTIIEEDNNYHNHYVAILVVGR